MKEQAKAMPNCVPCVATAFVKRCSSKVALGKSRRSIYLIFSALDGRIAIRSKLASHDQFIPLIDVGRKFDDQAKLTDPRKSVALLVAPEATGAGSALLVEEIMGQDQLVIKSLEANDQYVQGITGLGLPRSRPRLRSI
jgi:hypothetical protein